VTLQTRLLCHTLSGGRCRRQRSPDRRTLGIPGPRLTAGPQRGNNKVRDRAPAGSLIRAKTTNRPCEGPIPSESFGPSCFAPASGWSSLARSQGAHERGAGRHPQTIIVDAEIPSGKRALRREYRQWWSFRSPRVGRGVPGSALSAPSAPRLQSSPPEPWPDGRAFVVAI
jgi:hypothetical protein